MRRILTLALYTAFALGANTAFAQNSTYADITPLLSGDMKKLNFHPEPKAVSKQALIDENGTSVFLADYSGKYVLLNFWATWCPPCRKEMPSLSDLQTRLGGDSFEVVTLATGRNSTEAIATFLDEIGASNLPKFEDPKNQIARDMGVLGLPITVLISPSGEEVARLRGDADWASPDAIAVFQAVINQ